MLGVKAFPGNIQKAMTGAKGAVAGDAVALPSGSSTNLAGNIEGQSGLPKGNRSFIDLLNQQQQEFSVENLIAENSTAKNLSSKSLPSKNSMAQNLSSVDLESQIGEIGNQNKIQLTKASSGQSLQVEDLLSKNVRLQPNQVNSYLSGKKSDSFVAGPQVIDSSVKPRIEATGVNDVNGLNIGNVSEQKLGNAIQAKQYASGMPQNHSLLQKSVLNQATVNPSDQGNQIGQLRQSKLNPFHPDQQIVENKVSGPKLFNQHYLKNQQLGLNRQKSIIGNPSTDLGKSLDLKKLGEAQIDQTVDFSNSNLTMNQGLANNLSQLNTGSENLSSSETLTIDVPADLKAGEVRSHVIREIRNYLDNHRLTQADEINVVIQRPGESAIHLTLERPENFDQDRFDLDFKVMDKGTEQFVKSLKSELTQHLAERGHEIRGFKVSTVDDFQSIDRQRLGQMDKLGSSNIGLSGSQAMQGQAGLAFGEVAAGFGQGRGQEFTGGKYQHSESGHSQQHSSARDFSGNSNGGQERREQLWTQARNQARNQAGRRMFA